MKANRFISIFFSSLLLASCTAVEPEEVEVPQETMQKKVILKARMGNQETRVSYFDVTQEVDGQQKRFLHQQWNVGDWVYGFDDNDRWYYIQVTDIEEENGERIAIMVPQDDNFPTTGSIHLFYCGLGGDGGPNAVSLYDLQQYNKLVFYDFEDFWTPFYYSFDPEWRQFNNVASIMTADAELQSVIDKEDGKLHVTADLTFENWTAIIGIEGIQVDPGALIDRIMISGVRTGAVYSLETVDGKQRLVLDAGEYEADQEIAIDPNDGPYFEADEEGIILFDSPMFVAVYPREGGEETEDIVLSARVPTDDETTFYYYTYNLGPKEIVAGKYYYITRKRMTAPEIMYVTVQDDNEEGVNDEGVHEFPTLAEAFEYINSDAVDMGEDGTIIRLLGDYTASGTLPPLTGNENCTYVQFMLEDYRGGHTLTLDGCSLSAGGIESLWISGGYIDQPGEQAVLSASTGFTCLDGVVMSYGGSGGSPILVSGDGEVDIWGGHYSWITTSPLIGGTSTATSIISGGRFFKNPRTTSCVQLEEDFRIAKDDDFDYPYVCIPRTVYDNVARTIITTSEGDEVVLKTFSGGYNSYNPKKYYLARNNIYLMNDGRLTFEKPNWTSEAVYSNDSENPHINLFYSSGSGSIDQALRNSVNMAFGSLYCIMDTSDWEMLIWNREASTVGDVPHARFLKCEVSDGIQGHDPWRNLILFPDRFEWPAALAEKNPGQQASTMINKRDLAWDNALKLTDKEAQKMMDAGCVFLPAAGYITPTVSFEDSFNVEARYWNDCESSNPYYMSFNNGNVSSYSWGSQNDQCSVRAAFSTPE